MTPDLATMIAAAIPATTNPRRFVGIARIDDEEWALTDYPAPITGETPEVVAAQEALGAVLSERVGVRCDVLGVGRWENTTPTFVVQVASETGALDCADIVERAASLRWRSMSRRCATRTTQPTGRSGRPRERHTCDASTSASCTASSASAKSPCRRATAPRSGISSR